MKMWIGYYPIRMRITYPDRNNLSVKRIRERKLQHSSPTISHAIPPHLYQTLNSER